jgi:hypothetical protein
VKVVRKLMYAPALHDCFRRAREGFRKLSGSGATETQFIKTTRRVRDTLRSQHWPFSSQAWISRKNPSFDQPLIRTGACPGCKTAATLEGEHAQSFLHDAFCVSES